MPIKSNLKDLTPRREHYKREITLLSKNHTLPPDLKDKWPGGTITVFPWDHAVDTYFIDETRRGSDKDKLLYKLVARLSNLNGVDIEHFPAEEINTVLLVARSIGSEKVQYTATCPACNNAETQEISVPDELEKKGEKDLDWPGYDDIELPDCKDVVRLRILTVKDEQIITSRNSEQRRGINDGDLRVLMPVVSINDTTPDDIMELKVWFNALPPQDAKFLVNQERELAPHLNTAIPMRCDHCSHQYTHVLLFDRLFFR